MELFKVKELQYKKQPKMETDFIGKIAPEKSQPVIDAIKTSLADRTLILNRLKRPVQKETILDIPAAKKPFLLATADDESLKTARVDAIISDMLEDSISKESVIEEADVSEESDLTEKIEIDMDAAADMDADVKKKEKKGKAKATAEATAEATEAAEKVPKGKKKGTKKAREDPIGKFDLTVEKIGEQLITDRIPKKERLAVGVSSYYMNNRKLFISQLSKIFRVYSQKIADKSSELSCKTLQSQNINFDLLTHQLVVRTYLNLYTPYRGLLLFHGLGSGKTCTSIGVAEGMKTGKKIVLMTPASLKMNFLNELKKCGDVLYKKNQYWEFVPVEGDPKMAGILSQILDLDIDYIRSAKGAWLMNVKKESNFSTLSGEQQQSVDNQLNAMIRNKYLDINYNGLRREHLAELTQGGKVNPFDDKVVIIDEAHNLVSRIANTKKKDSIPYKLYMDLMDATNAKIIFLSGTPIINTPREIGILFNMLRGYIKSWTFTLETTTSDKINAAIISDYFRQGGLTTYDYLDYTANKLVITRNPFGFTNEYRRAGDKKASKKGGSKKRSKQTMSKKNKTKKMKEPVEEIYDDDENREIAKEYTNLQKDLYEGGSALDDYSGVKLDEMGNISDTAFKSRIVKILSDKGIRVIGSPVLKKETCLPDKEDIFNELFINNEKGELINKDLLKRRILGLTSYFRSAQEQLLPSFVKTTAGANYNIINIDMSDHQYEVYELIRKAEREEEKNKRKKKKMVDDKNVDDNLAGTYRIYSRSACNFAFPAEIPKPTVRDKEAEAVSENESFQDDDEAGAAAPANQKDDELIQSTYELLKYDPRRSRPKEYLVERSLGIYSPKFLQILQNINKDTNVGLHLLYSQFRTLEGIGIFKLVLEANGFVEFKLMKRGKEWEIENFDIDPEKPRFALYTGTEKAEEKDIIRNIYNGAWDIVPPGIVAKLRERHPDNLYGEIIKVLMITASGAEGINLRNTRFVHIMEPYWNMVRVDQVVGRARRICSHEDLPEDLRNVEVFIYICQATPVQIDKNAELRTNDLSKLAYTITDKTGRERQERVPFTTDQYLFEIAQIKDSITRQILTSVKETAIDCSLYNNNPDEPLVCYGFGRVESNNFASYPILERDAQEKVQATAKVSTKLVAVKDNDITYAVDKLKLVVYDMESYHKAKAGRGELVRIGVYDPRIKSILFDKA